MDTGPRSRRQSLAAWLLGLLAIVRARSSVAAPAPLAGTPELRTIGDLERLDPATLAPAQRIGLQVGGYWRYADGGGGTFDWVPDNADDPDGILIFAPRSPKPGVATPPGRWVRRVEGGVFTFEMAGARGDGKTDDWDRCQIAINALFHRFSGATIRLYPGRTYLIDRSDLNVAPGIIIEGTGGSLGQTNTELPRLIEAGSGFWLNPAHSVKLQMAAGLRDLWIMRKDIAAAPVPTAEQLGSQLAQWQADSSVGVRAEGDTAQVTRCTVIGFNTALLVTSGRFIIQDFHFDCTNGIEITRVGDVGRVRGAHAVPYYSLHLNPETLDKKSWYRSGIGYNVHDQADGVVLEDCFALCYRVGFRLSNVWDVCLWRPAADGSGPIATSEHTIGILCENCASFCEIAMPSVTAVAQALVLNQTDGEEASQKPGRGVFPHGFVTVRGGSLGSVGHGKQPIVSLGPYSRGVISDVLFNCTGTQPIGVGRQVRGWLIEDLRLWAGAPHEWISIDPSSRETVKLSGVLLMDAGLPKWLVNRS